MGNKNYMLLEILLRFFLKRHKKPQNPKTSTLPPLKPATKPTHSLQKTQKNRMQATENIRQKKVSWGKDIQRYFKRKVGFTQTSKDNKIQH